jgi:Tol biopolymer transport system component
MIGGMQKFKRAQVLAVALGVACGMPTQAQLKRGPKAAAKPPARSAKRKPGAAPLRVTPAMVRGKVVYIQGGALWCARADGSGKVKILSGSGYDFSTYDADNIDLSPDLSRILYTYAPPRAKDVDETVPEGNELFSVRLDGTGKKQLTDTKFQMWAAHPRWSPDGRLITYTRRTGKVPGDYYTANTQVRLMNADGTGDRALAGDLNDSAHAVYHSDWSRDGKRLIYKHFDGNWGGINSTADNSARKTLRTIRPDGTQDALFKGNRNEFLLPDISPNGKWQALAMLTRSDDNAPLDLDGLHIQNLDGSGRRRLTTDGTMTAYWPLWSPEGKHLAFEGSRREEPTPGARRSISIPVTDVWVINADGTGKRVVAKDAGLVTWLK